MRRVIEVAIWIRRFEVDRRRDEIVVQRLHREDRFRRRRRAQDMSGHRLRRADWNIVSVCAQGLFDCERLALVIKLCTRAMRIDIANFLCADTGFLQSAPHCLSRINAIWIRRRYMEMRPRYGRSR